MNELSLEQALAKAKRHTEQGEVAEALQAVEFAMQRFPRADNTKQSEIGSKLSTPLQSPPRNDLNRLVELFQNGQLIQARVHAKSLILKFPNSADVWNILGASSLQLGELEQAQEAFQKVITINHNNAEAYNNLGNVLQIKGEIEDALEAYEAALKINPDYFDAYKNLGKAMQTVGQLDAAIICFRRALNIYPNCLDTYNHLGATYREKNDFVEAIKCFENVISIDRGYTDGYNNLGLTLEDQGELLKAIAIYEKAISINSNNAEYYKNLGAALHRYGSKKRSREAFEKALILKSNCADSRIGLSYTLLCNGAYLEGLEQYEYRLNSPEYLRIIQNFKKPVWDGMTSLEGKTVLVWHEQGVGDTINWSYYLSILERKAKRCILICQEKLVPLLARSFPKVQVYADNKSIEAEEFDVQVPMGSLLKHLFFNKDKYICSKPFLKPNPERVFHWKERLKTLGDGPYIGISWKSSKKSPSRKKNYASIAEWAPLLKLSGVIFINLQYSEESEDLQTIQSMYGTRVHSFDDINHYDDIDDVAALCAALDCVVSTKITVPFISAGVGTNTKLANWKQSFWNNILLNPIGPNVDIYERNTWDPWNETFHLIADEISKI